MSNERRIDVSKKNDGGFRKRDKTTPGTVLKFTGTVGYDDVIIDRLTECHTDIIILAYINGYVIITALLPKDKCIIPIKEVNNGLWACGVQITYMHHNYLDNYDAYGELYGTAFTTDIIERINYSLGKELDNDACGKLYGTALYW